MSPERSLAALVALVLLVGGAGYVVHQYRFVETSATTTGTVRTATVDEVVHVGSIRLSGNTEYEPNVTYAYAVDGERYVGHDLFPGFSTSTGNGRRVAAVATRYDPGGSATVHYDPDDPGDAYLVPRYGFVPGFLAVAVGLLFAADLLTPGTRWLKLAARLVGRRRTRSDRRTRGRNEWNDPANLDVDGDGESAGGDANETSADGEGNGKGADGNGNRAAADAPVTGRLAWVVWVGAALGVLAVVGLYLAVSARPYDRVAYVAGLVAVAAPVVRAAFALR